MRCDWRELTCVAAAGDDEDAEEELCITAGSHCLFVSLVVAGESLSHWRCADYSVTSLVPLSAATVTRHVRIRASVTHF